MKTIFKYSLFSLNVVAALALGLASVSVFISPEQIWFSELFGMAYPYLLAINLIFIVFWVLFKPKFALLSVIIILAGYHEIGNYMQISGRQTKEKGIRIVSYNVRYFIGNSRFPNKETADRILDFLRQNNADIICLQEVRLNKRQVFDISKNRIPLISHMQLAHTSHAGGQLTLTRFPIVNMGELRFKDSGNMIIYTDMLINDDTVRVYNCHLQSYRLQPTEINSIDSMQFSYEPKNKERIMELGHKFKEAVIKRAEQAAALREHLKECPYSVIVCGDFNDTPVSYTYHTVRGNLKDSFIESGKGTANTYNGKLPSFRIDYILHSPSYKSYNFKVSSLNLSDHYPISCDLFPVKNGSMK